MSENLPEGAGKPKYYPGKVDECPLFWGIPDKFDRSFDHIRCHTWKYCGEDEENFTLVCMGMHKRGC